MGGIGNYGVMHNGNGIYQLPYPQKNSVVGFKVPNPSSNVPLGFIVMVPERVGSDGLNSEFKSLQEKVYTSSAELFAYLFGNKKQREMAYRDLHSKMSFDTEFEIFRAVYGVKDTKTDKEMLEKVYGIPFALLLNGGNGTKQAAVVYENGKPIIAFVEEEDRENQEIVVKAIKNEKLVRIISGSLEQKFGAALRGLEFPHLVPDETGKTDAYETILIRPANGIGLRGGIDSLLT